MRKWPTTKRRASNPNAMSTIPGISPMTVSCCVVRDANGGVAKKAGTAHARSARSPAFGVVVEATRRESRFKLSFTAGLCLPHEVCQKHLTDGWALFGEEIHLPLCAGAARTDGLRVRNAELESFIKGVADRFEENKGPHSRNTELRGVLSEMPPPGQPMFCSHSGVVSGIRGSLESHVRKLNLIGHFWSLTIRPLAE
jgi:hypothetical protein